LADVLKPEAKEVVQYLIQKMNVEVWMCTGDNRRTAAVVAAQLGLDDAHVMVRIPSSCKLSARAERLCAFQAEVLPSGKFDLVKSLQKRAKIVAMIGDGINDSPALAQADLGLAVGTGADIALQTADIVLMKNDLRDVVCALDLSKTTLQRIKWNFLWAFIYNVFSSTYPPAVCFSEMFELISRLEYPLSSDRRGCVLPTSHHYDAATTRNCRVGYGAIVSVCYLFLTVAETISQTPLGYYRAVRE
jgi:Cu+-exporting ATPase